MRIRINLVLENTSLNISYNSLIQGFIYHVIGEDCFSTQLHNEGNRIENRPFKLFVFSDIIAQAIYNSNNKELEFKSNGYFEIASHNEHIILKIVDYFQMNDYIVLGNKMFLVSGYDIISEDYRVEEKMLFSTISPVICNTTYNNIPDYIFPNTEKYNEIIINNIIKKYYLIYNSNPKKFEINNYYDIKERRVNFRKVFYVSYEYKIELKNIDKNILYTILSTGIGSKNSMGFGMLRYEKKTLPL